MKLYKKHKQKHGKEIELDIEKFSDMVNELTPGESLDIDEVVERCRVNDTNEESEVHMKELLIISKVALFISLLNTMLILLGIVRKSRSYRYE